MTHDSRHLKLRSFVAKLLCWLLLLYGNPLLALPASVEPRPWVSEWAGRAADSLAGLDLSSAFAWPGLFPTTPGPSKRLAGDLSPPSQQDEAPKIASLAGGRIPASLIHAAFGAPQDPTIPRTPPAPPGLGKQALKAEPSDAPEGFGAKSALELIPLLPGWNLVSLPEEPADPDPAVVLAAIGGAYQAVFAYDACDSTDPWKVYDPADWASSDLTAIDHHPGLWLEATQPVELPSDGTLPATTTFQLCVGWNLIGFPAGQPRHVLNALAPIAGKFVRVFGFDPADTQDPWEGFDVNVPGWANDLERMLPGRGYWILVTEATTLEIANQGAPPTVAITAPEDLAVITEPKDVFGTVQSNLLESWSLSHRMVGEPDWIEIASQPYPVEAAKLGTFDPTLLLNGLYELRLQATDVAGQQVETSIAVSVEGQMKIGNFTLSFIDLAIPLSGLDIEIVRTYDSRIKREGDFGVGWTLDIRQGSYRNNRPPGDGWELETGLLPCDSILEKKSHVTTIRLSDWEVYRFALQLSDGAPTYGGCFAQASFVYVDGPLPGSTLEILGSTEVFFANGSNRVLDPSSQEVYVPQDVRFTTRDGRIFDFNLVAGVTHLEDLNGNALEITPTGITHSTGRGVEFSRDTVGRIEKIIDPEGQEILYSYDEAGDLVLVTDRVGATTRFTYEREHFLADIVNALGVRAVRTEYDGDGRMIRTIDAAGKEVLFQHDLDVRREVVTNRLGHSRVFEYDERGNIISETDELGKTTLRTFDGSDRLTSETDPLDHATTFTYNPEGDVAKRIDPLGNTIASTYNLRGQPLVFTNARGKTTTRSYDNAGNLLQEKDALGHTTSYTYDGHGNVLTITRPDGELTRFDYDAFGNRIRETLPGGEERTFTYNANGQVLTSTTTRTTSSGPEILVTTFEVDPNGKLIRAALPDGTARERQYDRLGRLILEMDSLGRTTTFARDLFGRVIQTLYADGTSDQFSYDAEGRLISEIDRQGRVTTFTYDPIGRPLTTTYPDGSAETNTFDTAGRVLAVTNDAGHVTRFSYDPAGRKISETDALGNLTSYEYSPNGNLVSVKDPKGEITAVEYDDLDRVVGTLFPDRTAKRHTYDEVGRLVSETDQGGRTTHFLYDSLNRLTTVTDALGGTTRFSYDEVGNRVAQTDANGNTVQFGYDRLGRLTQTTLPTGEVETRTYDPAGNLTTRKGFNGQTLTFGYDLNNRLISKTYPDGFVAVFGYSPTGRRISATGRRGTTTYSYDNMDRLIEVVFPDDQGLRYHYDRRGNRTALTAVIGTQLLTFRYFYDAGNRLVSVSDPVGRNYLYGYDVKGNLTSVSYPNGLKTISEYDSLNRLTRRETVTSSGHVIQSFSLDLGPGGEVLGITELDGRKLEYEYDDLSRLTREKLMDDTGTVYEGSFSYDAVGNRLTQTFIDSSGSVSTLYTYDKRNRLLNAGGIDFSWDAGGNLLSKAGPQTTSYRWSYDNRLSDVTLADGTEVHHLYDIDGNRVTTVVESALGVQSHRRYLVDASDTISQVVAEIDETTGAVQVYTRASGLRAVDRGTDIRFHHTDHLGSVRFLTDESGAITDSYRYSGFGELLEHSGTDPNMFQFAGEAVEEESAFYYLRERWMDPAFGRFVSADSFGGIIQEPKSLHKYTYVENNPLSLVDPQGLFAGSVGSMTGLAVATAVVGIGNSTFGALSGSEAWKHERREWNWWDHMEYRRWTLLSHGIYVGQRIDCADLAVTFLVDYASRHGLPVHIHASERRFDSRSTIYRNPFMFREALKNTITAKKIWELNTYRKGELYKGNPVEVGDLLMSKAHTRVFIHRGGDAITFIEGNLHRIPWPIIRRISRPATVAIYTRHVRDVRKGTRVVRWWKDFVFRTVIP